MLNENNIYLKFLNNNCPINEEWACDGKAYQIKVNKKEEEVIGEWLEKIIGCSFFYEKIDEDYLNLKVTKSTLEKKLSDKVTYTPVKMDRFSLVKGQDHHEGGYHIIDNLINGRKQHGLYKTGIIFNACSDSEWVNKAICEEVLKSLNTNEVYLQMLDASREK